MSRLLTGANWGLGISFAAFCATIVVAYIGLPDLSLPAQIFAHLSIPLSAAGIKLFYVMRIAALRKIQLGVHQ